MSELEPITSNFWQEIPHPKDPFVANRVLCRGYDVFNQILGRADMTDYVCLLLFGEKPSTKQKDMMNRLAVILGNPGPRDPSVRAAMTAAAGGSSPVACLISALACGSGNLAGSHEIQILIRNIQEMQQDTQRWLDYLKQDFPLASSEDEDVFIPIEHPPGFFGAHEYSGDFIQSALNSLCQIDETPQLNWTRENFDSLSKAAGCAMQISFVVAAALYDFKLSSEQSEFVYLFLRLPGALAHALEQRDRGWRDYPFHAKGVHFTRKNGEPSNE